MKRILTALVLLSGLFGAGGAVWAGVYDKGWDAWMSDDYATALKEWRPLAEQGLQPAQHRLGALYENGGGGVLQDLITAHMWINIAAANTIGEGDVGRADLTSYVKARDRVEGKLSSSELAEARKRAKRCMDSKYKDCEAEPKSWWKKLLD